MPFISQITSNTWLLSLFQLKNEFTVDGFSPLMMSQFKLSPTCNLNKVKVDTSEASSSHDVYLYLYFLSAPYVLSSQDYRAVIAHKKFLSALMQISITIHFSLPVLSQKCLQEPSLGQ